MHIKSGPTYRKRIKKIGLSRKENIHLTELMVQWNHPGMPGTSWFFQVFHRKKEYYSQQL